MNVTKPLYISSRLMAALDIPGAGTVHIAHVANTADGRYRYAFTVVSPGGRVLEVYQLAERLYVESGGVS